MTVTSQRWTQGRLASEAMSFLMVFMSIMGGWVSLNLWSGAGAEVRGASESAEQQICSFKALNNKLPQLLGQVAADS